MRASVRLDEADDDVGAALEPPVRLVEHGDGLADARRRTEVDPQRATPHTAILSGQSGARRRQAREGEVELEHVDAGLAEEARRAGPAVCACHELPHDARRRARGPRPPASTCAAAYAGEMCGSRPLPGCREGVGGRAVHVSSPRRRRTLGHGRLELRVRGEVGAAARVAGVVARRRPAVEPLVARATAGRGGSSRRRCRRPVTSEPCGLVASHDLARRPRRRRGRARRAGR